MTRDELEYTAAVNAAAWLVSRAGKIARRIEGLSPKERQTVENEIVWIGRRLCDKVRKGEEK
jgi:leucyl-tRNA synthetase